MQQTCTGCPPPLFWTGQLVCDVSNDQGNDQGTVSVSHSLWKSRISTDLIYFGEPSSVLNASDDADGGDSKLIVGQRAAHVLHILSALHECRRHKVQAVLCSKVLQVLDAGTFQGGGGDGCVWQADVHALLQAAELLGQQNKGQLCLKNTEAKPLQRPMLDVAGIKLTGEADRAQAGISMSWQPTACTILCQWQGGGALGMLPALVVQEEGAPMYCTHKKNLQAAATCGHALQGWGPTCSCWPGVTCVTSTLHFF